MNLRSKMLLVVALIAGTFCAFVTKAILNSIPEEQEETAVVEEKTVPVMVAKRDLLPGDEVTPQNIRFDRLPESQVPSEAVNHYSDAKHRVLAKGVGKGQLISIYDLNEPELKEGSFYTPLNSGRASFMIGSVVGKGGDGEEFLDDIRRNIVPGVDKVDFFLMTEVREDNSPDGVKPLQRTSTVERILDNVDIYQVRVVQQQEAESDISQPRLEFSFILNDNQLEKLEEAAGQGRITIEFAADRSEEEQEESPLFQIEPLVTPVTPPIDSAEPVQEESLLLPTSTILPPLNLPPAPTQTVEAAPAAPAEKPEPAEPVERPRMSIPRPRVSIPRPDVAL